MKLNNHAMWIGHVLYIGHVMTSGNILKGGTLMVLLEFLTLVCDCQHQQRRKFHRSILIIAP